ncbi:MAG: indole-3-glycerol phosphate synthase TrpC [Terrimicrobiaceae bacterium]
MKTILEEILEDVAREVATAKLARPASDLRARIADAAPVRSLAAALGGDFGMIAEIKERSPSVGPMRPENVGAALEVYLEQPLVRAISVLTNETHFGMSIQRLASARMRATKPLLRKDFLIDEYQIREARAFGADAVLLMANVLDPARLAGFFELTQELGMEALFEVHVLEEIDQLPPGTKIVGINSRKFKTDTGFVGTAGHSEQDFSLDYSAFDLASHLPVHCLKIAESGLSPSNIQCVSQTFDAALVGTSLLRDPRGLAASLLEFEQALSNS